MFFVLRHAQRADDKTIKEDVFIENEWDPPLTSYGINQAKYSGEAIQSIIKKVAPPEEKREIRIISSPFLRCVQTASKVAEALGESTVYLEDGFCECLFLYLFPRNPLNSLVMKSPNSSLNYYLPPGIKYESASRHTPAYPESNMMEVRRRVAQAFSSYRDELEGWNDKMPIYIIVTHSYCVSVLTENIDHQNTRCSAILAPGYCALTYAYWINRSWKTKLICSDSHLKGTGVLFYLLFGLLLLALNYLRVNLWNRPAVV